MISEANIPNLMRCVRSTEDSTDFIFESVFHPCGSHGCLLGNDIIAALSIKANSSLECMSQLMFGDGRYHPSVEDWAGKEYGITASGRNSIYYWLFFKASRPSNAREYRLNRLRKFIYYVLHKRELLYDDSGRIRETARRAEGNHNVLAAVKRRVDEECAGVHSELAYLQSISALVPENATFPNEARYE